MLTTRQWIGGGRWLFAALLFVLLPAVALAQDDPELGPDPETDSPSVVYEIKHQHDRLEMVVNSSRILKLGQKIPKAVVNNPELLDVTPLSPTEIQIFAKKAGVTQINIWGEDEKVRSVDVIVFADAQELAMLLKHQFPNASLRVIPLANSVVISGYLDDPEQVERIVQMAEDFHPKVINNIRIGGVQQVLLHVKVMEVSRTKLRQVGFDFSRVGVDDFAISGVSGLIQSTASNTNVIPQIISGTGASAASSAGTVAFGVMDATRSATFFGVLDLLQEKNLAKLLAEPNLVCISGRPAFFNSGGEFPILVPQSLGTVSIQYKKYGTQLDFVPIVLGNGNIRLEVKPRVSEIDPARTVTIGSNSVPALRTREAETGVEMQAGQTLAIAGLVYNRQDSLNRGIPWLSDLPYVGAAFRRVRQKEEEVELLIMVTPQLVEPMNPCEVPPGFPGSHSATPNDLQLYLKGHLEVGTDAPLAPGAGAGQYPPHCPPPPGTFGPDAPGGCEDGSCPTGSAGNFRQDGIPPGAHVEERVVPTPAEEVRPQVEKLPGPTARRGMPQRSNPRQEGPLLGVQQGTPRMNAGRSPAPGGTARASDQRGPRNATASTAEPTIRPLPRSAAPQSSRPTNPAPQRGVNRVSAKPGFIGPTGYDVRN